MYLLIRRPERLNTWHREALLKSIKDFTFPDETETCLSLLLKERCLSGSFGTGINCQVSFKGRLEDAKEKEKLMYLKHFYPTSVRTWNS